MSTGTLVLGVLNGLIISLLAVGFVLVYKANRFLNLASAQLGVLSALLLLKVVNDWGWNWWLTFVACVVVGIATGLLVERFVIAPVRRRTTSPVRLLILTIGVSQVLLALTYIPGLAPVSQAPFPQPFSSNVQIGGVVLSGMSLLTLIAVPVLLVLLTLFLEFTSIGKQIRAAAGNPDAARLCGISVSRVSLITWGIAGGLAAIAAILNGPTTASFNAEALGPIPVDDDDGGRSLWRVLSRSPSRSRAALALASSTRSSWPKRITLAPPSWPRSESSSWWFSCAGRRSAGRLPSRVLQYRNAQAYECPRRSEIHHSSETG